MEQIAGRWQQIKTVLVVGAEGMLGREVALALSEPQWQVDGLERQIYCVDVDQVDIAQANSVKNCLLYYLPELVINCAAYTDVDGCESNKDLAMAVNGRGPENLARLCEEIHAKMVHISTDFVFTGEAGRLIQPDDTPNPQSVYAASKLVGEEGIARNLQNYIIVRTSWLFGRFGKNFVATIHRAAQEREFLEVVNDQLGSPTYAVDLAQAIMHLVGVGGQGAYHFCNEGICSWYDFAVEIVRQAGLSTPVRPISSDRLNRPAKRPDWSAMDISRYKDETHQPVRSWQDALAEYLQYLKQSE